jgi:hypothetical protein
MCVWARFKLRGMNESGQSLQGRWKQTHCRERAEQGTQVILKTDLEVRDRAEDELDLTYMGLHAQPQRLGRHHTQIHLQVSAARS